MESELSKFRKGKMLRYYLLGFIDAEGCFSVSLKKQETTRFGWVLDPIFQVTQHKDHGEILELIKSEMSCGRVIPKPGQEDCLIFVVDNRRQLIEKVLPFFEKYKPIAKKKDFSIFKPVSLLKSIDPGRWPHAFHMLWPLPPILPVLQHLPRQKFPYRRSYNAGRSKSTIHAC